MEKYEKYKDSGIPWLGTIPEHWEMRKAKYIFNHRKIVVGDNSSKYDLLSLTLQGIILRDMENPTGKFPNSFDTYQEVRVGDFVFCFFDNEETPRTVGLSNHFGMITGAYDVFECQNSDVCPEYVLHYYLTIDDSKHMKPLYKGLRKTIPYNSFMSYRVPIPPLEEQEKIAHFIESKTLSIDSYVAERERELRLLDELKQAQIADAVTHGLNPDVKMKDSGIPWIGMIPEHWKIKQLRSFLRLFSEKGHGNAQLLSVTREQGVIIRDKEDKEENHNFVPEDLSGYKYIMPGDFAINKMKAWQGSYAVSDFEGIVSPAYYTCKLEGVDKTFFSRAIRSKVYVSFFAQYSKGIRVGQWDLDPKALKSIPFLLPPLDEQRAIVEFIDRKCKNINSLISELEAEIAYLKEYKQRLVADAVTGQIKVF